MNRALALFLATLAMLLPAAAAHAQQGARVVERVSWVEEWDPASQQWVHVEDNPSSKTPNGFVATSTATLTRAEGVIVTETVFAEPVRFIARAPRAAAQDAGIARFGPFQLIDGKRAALIASTDAGSPAAFQAMLAAHPGLATIEFTDAPGTNNDLANLKLGRAIRAAGLATHVPDGGSARSGAVELFLAGTQRTIAPGALFAVHSWRDERGREPADFAPEAPENRLYLDYYTEMGMTADEARAFYAMTNSVPHVGALWLQAGDMARWIAPKGPKTDFDRTPAARELSPRLDADLRLALARSGAALVAMLDLGRLALQPSPRAFSPSAPRLAYADLGAGLLDSVPAFP